MHRKKKFTLLCIGITATAVLFNFCYDFSNPKKNQKSHEPFIVAKSRLKKGEPLTIENTKVVFLDLGVGSEYFLRNEEFGAFENFYIREELNANLPILKKHLMSMKSKEDNIPPGKRLFVFDVSVGPIVSILKPGDTIDVIAQINMPNLGIVTETILEAVKIIAIGNKNDLSNACNIENEFLSFYLTPDEVKIISFMKPYSNFSVVLRNPEDILSVQEQAVTFNRFLESKKIRKIIEADSFRIINGRNYNLREK